MVVSLGDAATSSTFTCLSKTLRFGRTSGATVRPSADACRRKNSSTRSRSTDGVLPSAASVLPVTGGTWMEPAPFQCGPSTVIATPSIPDFFQRASSGLTPPSPTYVSRAGSSGESSPSLWAQSTAIPVSRLENSG